jgi:DTW domain-containing protein YfiP
MAASSAGRVMGRALDQPKERMTRCKNCQQALPLCFHVNKLQSRFALVIVIRCFSFFTSH